VKGEGESGFTFTWSTHLFSSAHVTFCTNYLNDPAESRNDLHFENCVAWIID